MSEHTPTPVSTSSPPAADRATYEAAVAALRLREKAHTREGDAIAAARRRLPMVEVDADAELIGPHGPTTLLHAFEGRTQLVAYYMMWNDGRPAAEQCEGCTWCLSQIGELGYLHSRDITVAAFCQGPEAEGRRYATFMGWTLPWYSVAPSMHALLPGRKVGMMHLVSYLRVEDRVFETWWTTDRGVEALDNSYRLMDVTVFGRREQTEASPDGWPQDWPRDGFGLAVDGRPIPQWARLAAGASDDLTGSAPG